MRVSTALFIAPLLIPTISAIAGSGADAPAAEKPDATATAAELKMSIRATAVENADSLQFQATIENVSDPKTYSSKLGSGAKYG